MALSPTAKIVAGAFVVSGVIHLVRPKTFEPGMPPWLPAHTEIIVASGVAELACAAGLAVPQTRKVAGYASAALLLGVFPGNLQMAYDAMQTDNTTAKALTLARLPLQWPMIRGVWKAAREA